MIVYGATITSDIVFPLELSHKTATRYNIKLTSKVPEQLKNSISYGIPFYIAHGRNIYLYSDREIDDSVAGQAWCYEVKGVLNFYWVGGEQAIYYELDKKADENLLGFWFIHLLLPLYFTLEDSYDFLHAGAVEIEGKPILFIAPSMGGKSTLTDYFIQQGHNLVSDDKVATFLEHDRFMAVGSHPYHRPYRKFEELGYCVKNFIDNFKPIHAFYALEEAENDAEITLDEIKGFVKFDTILPNYLYMFSYLRPRRLKYLSNMLNNIRVFRVKVPWDLERLGEVHNAICVHSRNLK